MELPEAAQRAGVSVSGLRQAYRAGRIARRPGQSSSGRKVVEVDVVEVMAVMRARRPTRRDVAAQAKVSDAAPAARAAVSRRPGAPRPGRPQRQTSERPPEVTGPDLTSGVPRRLRQVSQRPSTRAGGDAGGVLVPREAYDRLVDQLGHLSDTHASLTKVTERAAVAETKLDFMTDQLRAAKSRVAELEAELTSITSDPAQTQAVAPPLPEPQPRRRFLGR